MRPGKDINLCRLKSHIHCYSKSVACSFAPAKFRLAVLTAPRLHSPTTDMRTAASRPHSSATASQADAGCLDPADVWHMVMMTAVTSLPTEETRLPRVSTTTMTTVGQWLCIDCGQMRAGCVVLWAGYIVLQATYIALQAACIVLQAGCTAM